MILQRGHLPPTREQTKIAMITADGSFTASIDEENYKFFEEPFFPKIDNLSDEWEKYIRNMFFIKASNVYPHIDENCRFDKPQINCITCSMFWVIKSESNLNLQVGTKSVRMSTGDYVVFPNAILHSVLSERNWIGAAAQVFVKVDKKVKEKVRFLIKNSEVFH